MYLLMHGGWGVTQFWFRMGEELWKITNLLHLHFCILVWSSHKLLCWAMLNRRLLLLINFWNRSSTHLLIWLVPKRSLGYQWKSVFQKLMSQNILGWMKQTKVCLVSLLSVSSLSTVRQWMNECPGENKSVGWDLLINRRLKMILFVYTEDAVVDIDTVRVLVARVVITTYKVQDSLGFLV